MPLYFLICSDAKFCIFLCHGCYYIESCLLDFESLIPCLLNCVEARDIKLQILPLWLFSNVVFSLDGLISCFGLERINIFKGVG